ncbi:hypothetical protein FACS1894217_01980 [Clostridia bacterium]|nr:hypothetical protein FACS1894217_01980 [Clostridia bacterium]
MNNFKQTPIPHRTKCGDPMQYFILSDDEQHTSVTRAECLSRTDEPDNPFPQRWFVDEESGLVVRLPRTAKGEKFARDNMRSVWREDKQQERKTQCIWKGTKNCDQQCDSCNCKSSRTVELDMHFGNDDSSEDSDHRYEPVADCDVAEIAEAKALLDTLHAALALLTEDERNLIDNIFTHGKTERELAPTLGLKEPKSVNKCGGVFGTKTWRTTENGERTRRIIWQCNEKYRMKGKVNCHTPHLTDKQIEHAFVVAFNQVLGQKSRYIEDYRAIIEMLTDTTALESEAASLQER